MATKKLDAKALKEKKQKKMAVILLVVFVAMLAFSVPKTMKMMNQQAAPAATPAPTSTAPPSAPGVAAAAGAAAVATADGATLVEADAVAAGEGQLVSFERFTAKDPFLPQIAVSGGRAAGAGSATAVPTSADGELPGGVEGSSRPGEGEGDAGKDGSAPGSGGVATGTAATPTTGGSTDAGAAPAPPAAGEPAAEPTTASISVNGAEAETVAVGGVFPVAEPIFELVELLANGAKIAIADGGYENGEKTVTLTVGRPLTLMNTADGTRYEILLVSVP